MNEVIFVVDSCDGEYKGFHALEDARKFIFNEYRKNMVNFWNISSRTAEETAKAIARDLDSIFCDDGSLPYVEDYMYTSIVEVQ